MSASYRDFGDAIFVDAEFLKHLSLIDQNARKIKKKLSKERRN